MFVNVVCVCWYCLYDDVPEKRKRKPGEYVRVFFVFVWCLLVLFLFVWLVLFVFGSAVVPLGVVCVC